MGIVLIVVVIGVIVITIAYFRYKARQARIAAVATLAQRIGFTFVRKDVERVVDMPFALFHRGEGRTVELVVSGTHNGLPMRLFDYSYYTQSADAQGHTSRDYSYFTCCLATIPAACPDLRLGHEGFFSRLGEHLGVHDIEFEYDAFNKRFRVKCDDQKFAFSLFDAQMMEWLLSADTFQTVEINGPWVLLATGKLDPERWLDLGSWIDQFHARIPAVVYATYPPR